MARLLAMVVLYAASLMAGESLALWGVNRVLHALRNEVDLGMLVVRVSLCMSAAQSCTAAYSPPWHEGQCKHWWVHEGS